MKSIITSLVVSHPLVAVVVLGGAAVVCVFAVALLLLLAALLVLALPVLYLGFCAALVHFLLRVAYDEVFPAKRSAPPTRMCLDVREAVATNATDGVAPAEAVVDTLADALPIGASLAATPDDVESVAFGTAPTLVAPSAARVVSKPKLRHAGEKTGAVKPQAKADVGVRVKRVRQLIAEGQSLKAAAKEAGVAESTLRGRLK